MPEDRYRKGDHDSPDRPEPNQPPPTLRTPHGEPGGTPAAEADRAADPYLTRQSQVAVAAMPSRTWPNLPGYEVRAELGRGGMGIVYRAWQTRLKRPVALKMILSGPHAGLEQLSRFRSEAEAVAQLQHPNIVQVYEVGEHEGRPYFSLEYVEGGSLDRLLAGTPQPPRAAAQIVEALARAMHHAHERGIVHRDLKPANILIADSGQRMADSGDSGGPAASAEPGLQSAIRDPQSAIPKITDFGLAKQIEADSGFTHEGVILGTPSYMAPEQAWGKAREVGPSCDVYALGAILYEMLTGRPPFKGANAVETLEFVRYYDPVPPSQLQGKVPRDLETICLKCLQKDPRRRYASAQALAEDLRRFLASEPILARPTGWLERTAKWVRRRPAQAGLVGSGLLAVAALIGGLVWHGMRIQVERDDARNRERLARLEAHNQDLLAKGEKALERQEWEAARNYLSTALGQLEAESGLTELRERADQLLRQARQQLSYRDLYRQFREARNQALFHQTLFTGVDLTANRQRTREAARAALDLFGLLGDGVTEPWLLHTEVYTMAQKEEILRGAYELVLVLADAQAQPLPNSGEDQREQARQALQTLAHASRLGPSTRAFHMRRARFLRMAGEEAEARQEQALAEQIVPRTAIDFFLVGDDEYQDSNLERARQSFDRALREQPDHFWARYYQALCNLKLNQPQAAKVGLTSCLDRQRDFVWAYLLRGFAHGELDELEPAEQDFAEALRLAPKGPDGEPDATLRYGVHVNRAVARLRHGKTQEAAADLEEAIGLKPAQYQAWVNLAQVYLRQADLAQKQGEAEQVATKLTRAIEQLTQATQLDPPPATLASIQRSLARLHLRRQDGNAALEALDRAIRAQPPRGRAEDHVERGRALHQLRRYREALEEYTLAAQLRPDHAPAQRGRAETWMELAEAEPDVAARSRAFEEALLALSLYLKLKGTADAALYRTRGRARARLANTMETRTAAGVKARLQLFSQAVEDFTLALQAQVDVATLTERGWGYLSTEASLLALADFENAIERNPEHALAHAGRGHARAKLGQHAAAARDAEKALSLGPLTPSLVCNAARIYALAVGRLDEIAAPGVALKETRRQYEKRAIELLSQALELQRTPAQRQAFWQEYVRADAALNPLRRSPEFQRLAEPFTRPTP